MTQIGIKDIRDNLADALNRVAYSGERIVLARRGKGVARLVSMEDLRYSHARLVDLNTAVENLPSLARPERLMVDAATDTIPGSSDVLGGVQ